MIANMNMYKYKEEKALQALYYIQSKTRITDKMSLLKLLFFADRFHIRKFCVPMLNDFYTAMRQGPVCSRTYDLIKKEQYFYCLPEAKQNFIKQNLSCKNRTIVTINNTGDDYLSLSDKMALNFSIEHFSSFDRKALSKISHAYPEWNKFKTILETKFSNAEKMSYLDFFDNPSPGNCYIKKFFGGIDPFEEDAVALKAKKEEYETILCE